MNSSNLAFTIGGAFVLSACAQIAGVGDRDRLTNDAGADAADAAAASDASSDAASEPSDQPVVEVCNFASENYDGLTDHGFDWTLGTWQSGPAVTNAGDVKAVALAGGRVAVAALGQDAARAQVFVVDATGALVAGPKDITAFNVVPRIRHCGRRLRRWRDRCCPGLVGPAMLPQLRLAPPLRCDLALRA